jgi:ribonucleotide reductase beta subunit family protein with ferritin-like domain
MNSQQINRLYDHHPSQDVIPKYNGTVNNQFTACCSLEQLTGSDGSHISDFKYKMLEIYKSNKRTTFFVIVKSNEIILEATLIKMGFTYIYQFERRAQYDRTVKLKMYIIQPIFYEDKNGNTHVRLPGDETTTEQPITKSPVAATSSVTEKVIW